MLERNCTEIIANIFDISELQPAEEKSSAGLTADSNKDYDAGELSRTWEPIDNFNAEFLGTLLERQNQGQAHDFLKENIVNIFHCVSYSTV